MVRFIDENDQIRKKILSVLKCKTGLERVGLYQRIKVLLASEGFEILDCLEKWYDRAGALASKDKVL